MCGVKGLMEHYLLGLLGLLALLGFQGLSHSTSPLAVLLLSAIALIVRTLGEGQCAKSLLLRQCRCYKGLTGLTSPKGPKGIAHQTLLSLCCTQCPYPRGGTLYHPSKPRCGVCCPFAVHDCTRCPYPRGGTLRRSIKHLMLNITHYPPRVKQF